MRRLVLLVVALTPIVGQVPVHAQGPVPKNYKAEQLRLEVPAALKKLEQIYANVHGLILRVDETNYDLLPESAQARQRKLPVEQQLHGVQLLERAEVRFAATASNRKCELITLERGTSAQRNKDAAGKQLYKQVDCLGPRGAFTLGWPTKDATPDLRDFHLEGGNAASHYSNQVQSWLDAAYTLPFGSLADLLRDKTFQIVQVDHVVVDGHDCPRAEFRYEFVPSSPAPKTKKIPASTVLVGSFVVDPELGWALRSYEYATPGTDQSQAAEITYQANQEGVATLAEVLTISRKARRNRATFQEIVFAPTPNAEFTLSHYGMPELDRPIGDVGASSVPRWIAGLSLVLLGAAVYFWYRSRLPRRDARLGV